ncbi:cytochrome P450 [Aspergillus floccosus]
MEPTTLIYCWYGACLSILLYTAGLVVYRLYLSPLAKFPGPRLAAATGLYEAYFQFIKGGRFTWEIERLHQIYGPVIRIKPFELHVKDPDYYSTLYSGPTRKRDKDSWFSYLGWPESIFSTEGHQLHTERRRVLGQFFKKEAIRKLQPVIQARIQSLCWHFSEAAKRNRTLELHACFMCFASDTLSCHAFGEHNCFHYLDLPEVTADWKTKINSCFSFVHIVRNLPCIYGLAHILPLLAGLVSPAFHHFYKMEVDVKRMVKNTLKTRYTPHIGKTHPIYPSMLEDEKVPESEKKFNRLVDDAIFLMVAGTDAPAQAMAITMFHILRNPEVHERLRLELCSAMPSVASVPSLDTLERLPYFNAVLKEGLRISSIVTTRLPRIAPYETLQPRGWHIPPGTPVSMSTYFILRDPQIFPEPSRFLPERWLLDPDDLRKLEKYLVPFSKGTLGCLGPNMTWTWLYLVLGTLLRRFELNLYETSEKNVEMTRDLFIGQTNPGLNMIQVKVLGEYSD